MTDVVFVPGFMTDRTLWEDTIPLMSTLDRYHFPDLGINNSIEAMARHVIKAVPREFCLVGFSMGGYVAREVARMVPSRVNKLALIATSARKDRPSLINSRTDAIRRMSRIGFKGLSRSSIKMSLNSGRPQDPRLIERILDMNRRVGWNAFVCQATTQRAGDTNKLSSIKCPTLVIAGDSDRLRSLEESEELVEGIPDSRMVVIPQSGHMIPLEQPREIAKLLSEWLSDSSSRRD